jgi:hypothetical protein
MFHIIDISPQVLNIMVLSVPQAAPGIDDDIVRVVFVVVFVVVQSLREVLVIKPLTVLLGSAIGVSADRSMLDLVVVSERGLVDCPSS